MLAASNVHAHSPQCNCKPVQHRISGEVAQDIPRNVGSLGDDSTGKPLVEPHIRCGDHVGRREGSSQMRYGAQEIAELKLLGQKLASFFIWICLGKLNWIFLTILFLIGNEMILL